MDIMESRIMLLEILCSALTVIALICQFLSGSSDFNFDSCD